MISLENAQLEYGITKNHINNSQIEGLRVPDPGEIGKFMFVYYVSDIIQLKHRINAKKREDGGNKTELHEKRRAELIIQMKKAKIADKFIEIALDTEGSLAYNYIIGKSKMPASKIAAKLLDKFEKWKEAENDDDEILPEPELILPLKRPKVILNQEEKMMRKMELIDRLLMMGVNSDNIGLDDPESIAVAYIEGRTKEDLGPVAGSIWRDHKPVFTGVPFRKTMESKVESSDEGDSESD